MELTEFNQRIAAQRDHLLVRARQLVGDNATAEDLVQETLLRLWTIRASLDAHPNPLALAMTTLHNKAIDLLRHRQLEQGHASPETTAINEVESRDTVALIGHIVDHLPPLQAQIFRMKEIEGYEASEIMAITGCSADNLRQCLSRARRKIREEYIRITKERR